MRKRSIERSFYPKNLHASGARARQRQQNVRVAILHDARRMELVADRFLVVESRVIDLASGDEVELITSTAGGPSDHARWLARCERFFALRHRAIATLVDYGLYSEHQRFEAWQVGHDTRGGVHSALVEPTARRFFAACGLTPLARDALMLRRSRDGRLAIVPDAASGYDGAGASEAITLSSCGIRMVPRPAVTKLADLLGEVCDARPRPVAIWGEAGAGVRTAVHELSRAARLQGFVPINTSSDIARRPELRAVVADRSLLVIHTRTTEHECPDDGWHALLEWVMETRRAHVLLLAGRTEVAHVAGLPLAPLTDTQLVNSVEPASIDDESRRRVRDAARRAGGNPRRFADLLWGRCGIGDGPVATPHIRPVAPMANRAAEAPATYGSTPVDEPASAALASSSTTWPLPGDLAALNRRLTEGVQMLRAGRHAVGERLVRQAIGALSRRREWSDAARGSLALTGALLARGRVAEAGGALSLARRWLHQTRGATNLWLDATVLAGHHALDLGRGDEAESILTAGFDAARSMRTADQDVRLRLALARCLFWRGRFDEAERLLSSVDPTKQSAATATRLASARARIAVGLRDFSVAITHANSALTFAAQAGEPCVLAAAARAIAFTHLAVGDLDAVGRDVASGLAAARTGRLPLATLKLRLFKAEACRRQGHGAAASACLRSIGRLARATVPFTIRARVELLTALVAGGSPSDVLRRRAAVGLDALALFVPASYPPIAGHHLPVDEVIELLQCCQMADDEGAVLRTVCGKLRKRLGAAAAAMIASSGAVLSSDGSRVDRRMAERIFAVGQAIPPHAWEGSFEGGAPVHYGGATIAALVVRWSLGSHVDPPFAASALALAATAAGPLVAEAIARQRQAQDSVGHDTRPRNALDIVGESVQIQEVRQAIERASAAPFPVLVEGESGSGKELVARAIHRRSPRRDRPFCSMNCAALPDDLVESELFGHARGAFTGAVAERTGVFEEAHTGTLFLDEIGELSVRAQAKLLRTIQEGELRRVGENVSRRVDVRIVAATNRDLRLEVAGGRFRLDLLYRLDVLRIVVPPLRERIEDIPLLADVFWQQAVARIGSKAVLSATTVAALARYAWPGNVRELQNVLAATAVRSPRRGVVAPTALPPALQGMRPTDSLRLDDARRGFEERFIRAALVRSGGRRSQTAAELGITRQGLTKLMTRLGIEAP